MKRIRTFLLLVSIFTIVGLAQDAKSSAAVQPRADQPIMASMVDRQISSIERKIVEAAEAMPEDKFNFSPESLNLSGSTYKGVRTGTCRSGSKYAARRGE
jgi:hypothetical protein